MQKLGYRSHKKKIYIGTDHAGFSMKQELVPFIKKLGYVYDKSIDSYTLRTKKK